MNNDKLIDGGLAKIEARLKELEDIKPGDYSFKTNCRYGETNLKALDLAGLQTVAAKVINDIELQKKVGEYYNEFTVPQYFNAKVEEELQYTLCDIMALVAKRGWEAEKRKLETTKAQLENFYSEDKRNLKTIESLLANL